MMGRFGRRPDISVNDTDLAESENEINISDDELYDELSETNGYYEKVSKIYSTVRYVLIIVLVIFVTLSTIKNSGSITYSNLMFLFKDLGSAAESSNAKFGTITYNPDTTLACAGFRKNLATASSAGVKIYSGDGKKIFDGTDKFVSPMIETSDRYLLVYDFGGKDYALYNSFARIFTEELDYEITGADISESGTYAIVTRTKEYNSAVLLYTKNCVLKTRYKTDDRVTDVSVNRNGTRLCVLSFTSENAAFVTRIVILKPGETTAVAELTLSDTFPLACNYTDDGRLTVFCDNALYFYDGDGNLESSFPLSSVPNTADFSDDGCVISASENAVTTGNRVTVLDTRGNTVYSGTFSGKTAGVAYCDGYLFVLSGNRVCRTNVKSGETVEKTTEGGKKMIVYSGDDVLVCSQSKAEYFNFDITEDND